MALGVFSLLFLVGGLASLGLLIWSLYLILTTPQDVWEASGMSQILWLVVVLVLPFVGSLLFLIIGRPRVTPASGSSASPV